MEIWERKGTLAVKAVCGSTFANSGCACVRYFAWTPESLLYDWRCTTCGEPLDEERRGDLLYEAVLELLKQKPGFRGIGRTVFWNRLL